MKFKVTFFIFAALIFWGKSFALESIDQMAKARQQVIDSIKILDAFESINEITSIEENFNNVLETQTTFCRKSIVELNEYFLKETDGEIDSQKIKKDCLLSIRKWHINVEKKLFKLKRVEIKRHLEKSLTKLNEMEEKTINEIVKLYKDSI